MSSGYPSAGKTASFPKFCSRSFSRRSASFSRSEAEAEFRPPEPARGPGFLSARPGSLSRLPRRPFSRITPQIPGYFPIRRRSSSRPFSPLPLFSAIFSEKTHRKHESRPMGMRPSFSFGFSPRRIRTRRSPQSSYSPLFQAFLRGTERRSRLFQGRLR